jgi:hypothetical protein
MRRGTNPAKHDTIITDDRYHRVIMPVFIPELDGYFTDALKILTRAVESLLATIHSKTAVTIINNGSCAEVSAFINTLVASGQIDCCIHYAVNFGKIDPLISAMRGCHEPIITVTDADVLFQSGWQSDVEEIFEHFPKAGFVSPVPIPSLYRFASSYTFWWGMWRGRLKFTQVLHRTDMQALAESLGRPGDLFNEAHYSSQLTLNYNGKHALVGAAHFVASVRKEVVDFLPRERSYRKMIHGGGESFYLDLANDRAGLLRLATTRYGARHMGNTWEPWMAAGTTPQAQPNSTQSNSSFKMRARPQHLFFYLRQRLVSFLLTRAALRTWLFKRWGLASHLTTEY